MDFKHLVFPGEAEMCLGCMHFRAPIITPQTCNQFFLFHVEQCVVFRLTPKPRLISDLRRKIHNTNNNNYIMPLLQATVANKKNR